MDIHKKLAVMHLDNPDLMFAFAWKRDRLPETVSWGLELSCNALGFHYGLLDLLGEKNHSAFVAHRAFFRPRGEGI